MTPNSAPSGSIRTWTGQWVNPLELDGALVNIDDIAHALARLCRFNGHCAGFLSVARHSVWVADHLEAKYDTQMAYFGLLHDASEAYLSDIPRPLKHNPEMAPYREIEERAEQVVAGVFGLPHPLPLGVKEADRWVLYNLETDSAKRPARNWYQGDIDNDEHDFLSRYDRLRFSLGMAS